jgi:hypothetical protein
VASIINEVESIGEFVESLFPTANFHYQDVPADPEANDIVIRALPSEGVSETGYHYRLDRTFQVIVFGRNSFASLQQSEQLEKHFNDTLVLPIKGSDRFLRLESFNLSQPFKTESGTVSAVIGVLSAHLREARTQPVFDKIEQVHAEFRSEIGVTVTKTICNKE